MQVLQMELIRSRLGVSAQYGLHLVNRRYCQKVDLDKVYNVATKLAQEAGKLMMSALKTKPAFDIKMTRNDVVTETDLQVERMLISNIRQEFPDHKFIAEEGTEGSAASHELTDAPTWIIDPIDGTMNFVHGFPHFCLSLALYVEQRAEFGLIYNPMLRHEYKVQRGCGVYFNGKQVRTSGQCELQQALMYQEWSIRFKEQGIAVIVENTSKLLPVVHGMRTLGSAALNLAHVACGACDAYYHFGPHVWDWAAGVFMVREAGGVVMDPCGSEFNLQSRRILAAATPELAEQIVPLLSQLFPPRLDEQPK